MGKAPATYPPPFARNLPVNCNIGSGQGDHHTGWPDPFRQLPGWPYVPSITTTLSLFGQFLGGNRIAERKATRLSRVWDDSYEEVLKAPFLRTVVVILEIWPESGANPVAAIFGANKRSEG